MFVSLAVMVLSVGSIMIPIAGALLICFIMIATDLIYRDKTFVVTVVYLMHVIIKSFYIFITDHSFLIYNYIFRKILT